MTDAENDRTRALDAKAASVATFAALVLSLNAALGATLIKTFEDAWAFALFTASLLTLLVAAGLSVSALFPKEYITLGMAYLERFPKWSEILKSPEQVRGETMAGLVEAIARGRRLNSAKARDVRWAFVALAAGLILVAVDASILEGRKLL